MDEQRDAHTEPVEVTAPDGRVPIDPAGSRLREDNGHLLLPRGLALTADEIRELRLADQR
ncbi:MAG: hypothetical protein LBI33_13630 [Propionibacteriaceae bacterium]|nr:hypothetical protein [Propionibacteriaceae bacterium]